MTDFVSQIVAATTSRWWTLVLRGVIAIAFGAMALVWPSITLTALAILVGAFALVDGIVAGIAAFRAPREEKAPLVLLAIAGIAFGLAVMVWPDISLFVLTLLIGVWALIRGIVEIVDGAVLAKGTPGRGSLITAGVLSAAFGLLVMWWPESGAFAIAVLIGITAIILGIYMISAGIGARKLNKRATRGDYALGSDS